MARPINLFFAFMTGWHAAVSSEGADKVYLEGVDPDVVEMYRLGERQGEASLSNAVEAAAKASGYRPPLPRGTKKAKRTKRGNVA